VKGISNLNARLIEYKRSDNRGMHFMGAVLKMGRIEQRYYRDEYDCVLIFGIYGFVNCSVKKKSEIRAFEDNSVKYGYT
jgi:hypothetical protein